jgi:hypothetical protein
MARDPASHPQTSSRLLGHTPGVPIAMAVGGSLWIVYGYFRFLMPRGPDVMWREDLQYSAIISTELFLLYNLPGILALLLTAWAALSCLTTLQAARTGKKRTAQALLALSFLFGVLGTVGQVVRFDPLTTGGLGFGVPILGLAVFLAGLSARGGKVVHDHSSWSGLSLVLLGVIGMFTLPLRPLMFALSMLPLAFGTAVFALFGAGWIGLGFKVWLETARVAGRPA